MGELDEDGQNLQTSIYKTEVNPGDVIDNMMTVVNTAVWYT